MPSKARTMIADMVDFLEYRKGFTKSVTRGEMVVAVMDAKRKPRVNLNKEVMDKVAKKAGVEYVETETRMAFVWK